MQRPDENTLRAIVNLQGNPNWERIIFWFIESLNSAIKSLYENTIFNGGRVAEIQDLIEKIDKAKEKFDEIQRLKREGS